MPGALTPSPALRFTLLDGLIFIACIGIGLAFHVRMGTTTRWHETTYPRFLEPMLDGALWCLAPAVVTAAILLPAQFYLAGRSRRMSWIEWTWLALSLGLVAMAAIGQFPHVGVLLHAAYMLAVGTFCVSVVAAPIVAVGLVVTLLIPGWRARLSWTDLLGTAGVLIILMNMWVFMDAVHHL